MWSTFICKTANKKPLTINRKKSQSWKKNSYKINEKKLIISHKIHHPIATLL